MIASDLTLISVVSYYVAHLNLKKSSISIHFEGTDELRKERNTSRHSNLFHTHSLPPCADSRYCIVACLNNINFAAYPLYISEYKADI